MSNDVSEPTAFLLLHVLYVSFADGKYIMILNFNATYFTIDSQSKRIFCEYITSYEVEIQ